jgi:hypothetical protein
MKKAALALAFLLLAFSANESLAFSTEPAGQKADGSPQFADPDTQAPVFMNMPVAAGGTNLAPPPPQVSMPSIRDVTPGAQAFDRSFDHQQDK